MTNQPQFPYDESLKSAIILEPILQVSRGETKDKASGSTTEKYWFEDM